MAAGVEMYLQEARINEALNEVEVRRVQEERDADNALRDADTTSNRNYTSYGSVPRASLTALERRHLAKRAAEPTDKRESISAWLSAAAPTGGAKARRASMMSAGSSTLPGGGLSKQQRAAVAASVMSVASSARMSMQRTMSHRTKSGRVDIKEKESWWFRVRNSFRNMDTVVLLDTAFPIVHPESTFKKTWDLFVMSMVIYTALAVPLELSYGLVEHPARIGVEYAMDIFFLFDLLGNFRTAYFNYQGELVRDTGKISQNYMQMWFWIDLGGTVPIDTFVFWAGVDASDGNLQALGVLKILRMLRLARLLRFMERLKGAKLVQIFNLFLAMALVSHWLSCIWYMMYRYGGKDDSKEWRFTMDNNGQTTALESYIECYYSSFLLLVGDNIVAYNNYERVFMIFVLLGGTLLYSAVVGQMAMLVATLNVASNRHGQKLIMTQDALRYAGAKPDHAERVQTYYEYLQTRSHPGMEGMTFLNELPEGLALHLAMFLHEKSLLKLSIFHNCEPGFINALARRIKMVNMAPTESIFRVGDAGKEMFIIKKGCVAVTSKRGETIALMQPGDIFGEVALLSTGKRTANCISLGWVDLAVLTQLDMQIVMRDYPVSAALIQERAATRAAQLTHKKKMWLDVDEDEQDLDGIDDDDDDGSAVHSDVGDDNEPPPDADDDGGGGGGGVQGGSKRAPEGVSGPSFRPGEHSSMKGARTRSPRPSSGKAKAKGLDEEENEGDAASVVVSEDVATGKAGGKLAAGARSEAGLPATDEGTQLTQRLSGSGGRSGTSANGAPPRMPPVDLPGIPEGKPVTASGMSSGMGLTPRTEQGGSAALPPLYPRANGGLSSSGAAATIDPSSTAAALMSLAHQQQPQDGTDPGMSSSGTKRTAKARRSSVLLLQAAASTAAQELPPQPRALTRQGSTGGANSSVGRRNSIEVFWKLPEEILAMEMTNNQDEIQWIGAGGAHAVKRRSQLGANPSPGVGATPRTAAGTGSSAPTQPGMLPPPPVGNSNRRRNSLEAEGAYNPVNGGLAAEQSIMTWFNDQVKQSPRGGAPADDPNMPPAGSPRPSAFDPDHPHASTAAVFAAASKRTAARRLNAKAQTASFRATPSAGAAAAGAAGPKPIAEGFEQLSKRPGGGSSQLLSPRDASGSQLSPRDGVPPPGAGSGAGIRTLVSEESRNLKSAAARGLGNSRAARESVRDRHGQSQGQESLLWPALAGGDINGMASGASPAVGSTSARDADRAIGRLTSVLGRSSKTMGSGDDDGPETVQRSRSSVLRLQSIRASRSQGQLPEGQLNSVKETGEGGEEGDGGAGAGDPHGPLAHQLSDHDRKAAVLAAGAEGRILGRQSPVKEHRDGVWVAQATWDTIIQSNKLALDRLGWVEDALEVLLAQMELADFKLAALEAVVAAGGGIVQDGGAPGGGAAGGSMRQAGSMQRAGSRERDGGSSPMLPPGMSGGAGRRRSFLGLDMPPGGSSRTGSMMSMFGAAGGSSNALGGASPGGAGSVDNTPRTASGRPSQSPPKSVLAAAGRAKLKSVVGAMAATNRIRSLLGAASASSSTADGAPKSILKGSSMASPLGQESSGGGGPARRAPIRIATGAAAAGGGGGAGMGANSRQASGLPQEEPKKMGPAWQ